MSIRKTIFDTIAISSVNVFRLLAQFLAVPILSRILSPSDYGVVAMAMPFLLFAMVIADAGIGMSLVRTSLQENRIWSTCFWLSVMLGAGLALIMVILAPIVSTVFVEPRLNPIVMALALVVFVQSLCAIQGAALQQQQKFRLVAITEIVSVVVSVAIAILVAVCGGGAWALVMQQLALYGVRVVFTVWFSPFRPRFVFNLREVKEHLMFGRNVLSVNIIGFFSRSIDNLVIGRVLTTAAVGVYSMAFQFARLPGMLVTGPLQYVFYAKLVQVKENISAIRRTFLVLTRILALLIFPTMGMVAVAYHPVFTLLLSAKWAPAGRIFMLVSAASALQAVMGLCGTVRMVLGRTDYQLKITIESGILWIIGLMFTVRFGLDWLAIAYSIVFILYSPRMLMLALPLIDCPPGDYIRAVIGPLLVTLLCVAAFLILDHVLQMGEWAQLLVAAALAILGVGISVLTQYRVLMAELLVWKKEKTLAQA